jgi:hypothetical protein
MRKFFCTLSLFIAIPLLSVGFLVLTDGAQKWCDSHWGKPPEWICWIVLGVLGATLAAALWSWCSDLCGALQKRFGKQVSRMADAAGEKK